jgi:hypothetical protein
MPEVEKVEFSGAVLEGEVYLRAYDVTHALRGAIDYYTELIDNAADEAPEGSETEWYTSLVCWSSIIEALTAEADAYDVASMEFLAQHEDEDDEDDEDD